MKNINTIRLPRTLVANPRNKPQLSPDAPDATEYLAHPTLRDEAQAIKDILMSLDLVFDDRGNWYGKYTELDEDGNEKVRGKKVPEHQVISMIRRQFIEQNVSAKRGKELERLITCVVINHRIVTIQKILDDRELYAEKAKEVSAKGKEDLEFIGKTKVELKE